ncbi:MAG TPA: SdrD B-like domain-containing protein, partial [Pirellulaceae bacterium]
DRDNDGRRETGEEGLGGTLVRLFDAQNREVAQTTTDLLGHYEFTHLAAGRYTVLERQPTGWIDGLDTAGTVNGTRIGAAINPGDRIEAIDLLWGDQGVEYDFGEFLGARIEGHVCLANRDGDCFGAHEDRVPVANALIRLFNERGELVGETRSDLQGHYAFEGLLPGRYRVVEFTPEGLIDGDAHAGTVNGQAIGTVINSGLIENIVLFSGQAGVNYDFCELPPSMISGFVYHDRNDNGVRETGEEPIAGVVVELLDDLGRVVATVMTNLDGSYKFGGIHAGTYMLREAQPSGWLDGQDAPGIIHGSVTGQALNPGDKINAIVIGWGDMGTDYNFGELLPASIEGLVHTDVGISDCVFRPEQGEIVLAGVRIELLDSAGNVVARTETDAAGQYRFTGLRPGTYHVRELQPQGYFNGNAKPGSHGGQTPS